MEPLTTSRPDASLASRLSALAEDEGGVTAIEYGLIAALITIACLAAFTAFAGALNNVYLAWVIPALQAILAALG